MNVLIAGFGGLKYLEAGISDLTKSGLTCYQVDNGDEIMALLEKVEFAIIAFRFHPAWSNSGIRFRNNPGRYGLSEEDKQCAPPGQFYATLRKYLKERDTKSIYAFMPECWPWQTLRIYTHGDWDDVLIHPDTHELITSIERALFRCLRRNDPLKRFHQLSSLVHLQIGRPGDHLGSELIYELPLLSADIRSILGGTDILFNSQLLTLLGEPAFPFPLTLWAHENETYCCYALSKYLPIVTHKTLPFMQGIEWVRADSLVSEG